MWLDHAAWERQDFLVALRLGLEISDDDGLNEEHRQTFDFHIALLSGLLRSIAPGLSERRAGELVESLLALSFGAAVIGTEWTPAEARTRFIRLLMPDLVRSGGELDRLRMAMSAKQPHPAHGPCSIEVASNAGFFAMAPNPLTRRLARP